MKTKRITRRCKQEQGQKPSQTCNRCRRTMSSKFELKHHACWPTEGSPR